MPKSAKPSFASLPNAVLLSICETLQGDGHGIYYPKFLADAGVPQPLIEQVYERLESDGTYKGSIFPAGTPPLPGERTVDHMYGVASLSLYYRLCSDLGISSDTMYLGRGRVARALDARIREHLATRPEPAAA